MISSQHIDVFNGDADGIIALHQLRLAEPRPEAKLISGVKRDIRLLGQVSSAENCTVTVLDISLDSNRDDLLRLLNNDCSVRYIDHHFSGAIPDSPRLTVHIDPSPDICTSLIVDRLLNGRFRAWAIAAAFGDNLHDSAVQTAKTIRLTDGEIKQLRELGELLNYNGYGVTVDDLHFTPQQMYQAVHAYEDPFDFIHNAAQLEILRSGFEKDITMARSLSPLRESPVGRIFELPPESWSRRIVGVFSNELARQEPDLAHALLIRNPDESFSISVRAPLNNKQGADSLCLQFPTGGGRKAAAGINALPPDQLQDFLNAFETAF
jgi:hypothetical protein